ncbi:hypothetical protein KFK09_011988 [Dendrobium nobile]|uniref:Uncharacterized protein n=1 Tax=Dendrobium nobile TaxID=94219 RepID=A0A8T3BJP3_DENNO|nr:hypothetical protein KFK09_011988 [Dendrobium nobile]
MKNQDHEGKEACKEHLALLFKGNQCHPPDLHDFKDHQILQEWQKEGNKKKMEEDQ